MLGKDDCQPRIERYTLAMTLRWVFFIAAIFLTAGCATERTVLVNSRGDELTCETTGGGIFGAAATGYEQNHCISEAEQRGYRVK
jgi:hypothetical protein